MNEAVHGHEPAHDESVFFKCLNTIGRTGRNAGATVSIHCGNVILVKGDQPGTRAKPGILVFNRSVFFFIGGHCGDTQTDEETQEYGDKNLSHWKFLAKTGLPVELWMWLSLC
jgi:hypothetical protein